MKSILSLLRILKSFSKLTVKYSVHFLAFTAISVFLSACLTDTDSNNNNNNTGYDSARFNWQIDTIEGKFFYDAYYADTDKIFFLTSEILYEYNGSSFIPHYFGYPYIANCISGSSPDNVCIAGGKFSSTGSPRACLLKWNGAGFEEYPVTDTTSHAGNFYSIRALSQTEVWFSSTIGRVYKFDGSVFTRYSFDSNYFYIDPFMTDGNGNIYFASEITTGSPIVENTFLEFHKFNGIEWSTVFSQNYPGGTSFEAANFGTGIFCSIGSSIKAFNGSGFIDIAQVNNIIMVDGELAGSSPGNIFVNGYEPATHKDYLMNYNGTKWSKELVENDDYQNFHYFYASSDHVFLISYNYNNNSSIIVKGVRK